MATSDVLHVPVRQPIVDKNGVLTPYGIKAWQQIIGALTAIGVIQVGVVAFADLPAAPVEGMILGVSDSNTATWGATITGTGANHVLAYYDGTNWTVMAQ